MRIAPFFPAVLFLAAAAPPDPETRVIAAQLNAHSIQAEAAMPGREASLVEKHYLNWRANPPQAQSDKNDNAAASSDTGGTP